MQSTPTSSDAEQPQPFPFQPVELQELVKNKYELSLHCWEFYLNQEYNFVTRGRWG